MGPRPRVLGASAPRVSSGSMPPSASNILGVWPGPCPEQQIGSGSGLASALLERKGRTRHSFL